MASRSESLNMKDKLIYTSVGSKEKHEAISYIIYNKYIHASTAKLLWEIGNGNWKQWKRKLEMETGNSGNGNWKWKTEMSQIMHH